MGKSDEAGLHFEEAMAFCRKGSISSRTGIWTLHDFAGMLVEQDGEGDKAKATTMLDEASQISTALNIRPLMERLLSKGDILKA